MGEFSDFFGTLVSISAIFIIGGIVLAYLGIGDLDPGNGSDNGDPWIDPPDGDENGLPDKFRQDTGPGVVDRHPEYYYKPPPWGVAKTHYEHKYMFPGGDAHAIAYAETWDSYASWPWKSDEPEDEPNHYETHDKLRMAGVPVTPLYIAYGVTLWSSGEEYWGWSTHPWEWVKR